MLKICRALMHSEREGRHRCSVFKTQQLKPKRSIYLYRSEESYSFDCEVSLQGTQSKVVRKKSGILPKGLDCAGGLRWVMEDGEVE